ncbi:MAG TPA: hypothetical protein VFJ70_23060 [Burkholderiales bacterium]|nr:hypothetical protein [Burkholderiales bacterium]
MAEAREPIGPEFIPLARVAAMVHDRLFPEHACKESKTLDVIALALSAVVPLYRRDSESGAVERVSEQDLATGRFSRGATTLEFGNRSPLRFLVVAREDLSRAIETLVRDSVTAARVSLTLRQSPRPRPPD